MAFKRGIPTLPISFIRHPIVNRFYFRNDSIILLWNVECPASGFTQQKEKEKKQKKKKKKKQRINMGFAHISLRMNAFPYSRFLLLAVCRFVSCDHPLYTVHLLTISIHTFNMACTIHIQSSTPE